MTYGVGEGGKLQQKRHPIGSESLFFARHPSPCFDVGCGSVRPASILPLFRLSANSFGVEVMREDTPWPQTDLLSVTFVFWGEEGAIPRLTQSAFAWLIIGFWS